MKEFVSASQGEAPVRFMKIRDGVRGALRAGLDIVLPPLCPSCGAPLGGGAGLCADCWSKLSLIEPPYCARLDIPFVYDPGPGLLWMEAIANPPAYERARAAVRYDNVARALLLSFKYGDRLDLAPMMGQWMARCARDTATGRAVEERTRRQRTRRRPRRCAGICPGCRSRAHHHITGTGPPPNDHAPY